MTRVNHEITPVSRFARDWVEQILAGSALARRLGIWVGQIERDRVALHMPFRSDNVTVGDTIHGGAIATLIDIAGASASGSSLGEGEASGGATITLNIAYLAAANGVDLTAEARVIQRNRRQTVTEVDVRDPDGRAIAKGLVTSRIFVTAGGR